MRSFRTKLSERRQAFISLAGQIEGQLRDAYAKRYEAGEINQTALAAKLDVDKSAIHRRLTGRTNMTVETLADMAWALGHKIKVDIFDPLERDTNRVLDSARSDGRFTFSPPRQPPSTRNRNVRFKKVLEAA